MNVSGAAQADVAVLVVNATSGEFETGFDAGGQTREHTMLARSLGIYRSELRFSHCGDRLLASPCLLQAIFITMSSEVVDLHICICICTGRCLYLCMRRLHSAAALD